MFIVMWLSAWGDHRPVFEPYDTWYAAVERRDYLRRVWANNEPGHRTPYAIILGEMTAPPMEEQ